MKRLLAIAALTLLLTSCRFELPAADTWTVDVFRYDGGSSKVVTSQLSFMQGKALAEWFSRHSDGWEYKVADFAPETYVILKRDGVVVAGINIGSSFVYVKSRFKALTKDEAAELRAIIAPTVAAAGKEANQASQRCQLSRSLLLHGARQLTA